MRLPYVSNRCPVFCTKTRQLCTPASFINTSISNKCNSININSSRSNNNRDHSTTNHQAQRYTRPASTIQAVRAPNQARAVRLHHRHHAPLSTLGPAHSVAALHHRMCRPRLVQAASSMCARCAAIMLHANIMGCAPARVARVSSSEVSRRTPSTFARAQWIVLLTSDAETGANFVATKSASKLEWCAKVCERIILRAAEVACHRSRSHPRRQQQQQQPHRRRLHPLLPVQGLVLPSKWSRSSSNNSSTTKLHHSRAPQVR